MYAVLFGAVLYLTFHSYRHHFGVFSTFGELGVAEDVDLRQKCDIQFETGSVKYLHTGNEFWPEGTSDQAWEKWNKGTASLSVHCSTKTSAPRI
jgi:hypothetical protein